MPEDSPDFSSPAWFRELASSVDYAGFRRIWLNPVTERAEKGYLAACYERVAVRANSEGEYFLAHDAACHGLRCASASDFPPHRLTAQKLTALARSGATAQALRLMEEFLAIYPVDRSTASTKARLLKEAALVAPDLGEHQRLLGEAADWAEVAKICAEKEGADWAYPAGQEVIYRFLKGDRPQALAESVIAAVKKMPDTDTFWNQTNLAEMHLVKGDFDQARAHYQRAASLADGAVGDLAANRAVAALLLEEWHLADAAALLDAWFPQPVVVVFSGHLPDATGRTPARLPESLCRPEGPIARFLADRIAGLQAVECCCATAPGGDLLFAEAALEAGAAVTLQEPFPRERLMEVARQRGADWLVRLQSVFRRATRSAPVSCAKAAAEEAQCEYANHVLLGSAMLRSRRIHGRLHALVLWDETDSVGFKRGGTAHFVSLCNSTGVPVEVVHPARFFTDV
jgi:tetratricopeptide (TPR) repeat protein